MPSVVGNNANQVAGSPQSQWSAWAKRILIGGMVCVACLQCTTNAQESGAQKSREDFELMKLFVETYEQIDTNYVRDINRRELVEAAIQGMLQHLDQYSSYISREDVVRFDQSVDQEFGGIGIQVNGVGGRLTVVSPLPGTPAYRAGVRSGDVIAEVDGASTDGFTVTDAVKVLQGPPGRPVTLGIRRPGTDEIQQIRIQREVIKVPTVLGDKYNSENEWEYMLDDDRKIGYIRLTHFSPHTTSELRTALSGLASRGLKGLILDLRSNPGGLLESAIEISDMFLDSGEIVSVKGRNVTEKSWKARKGDAAFGDFPVAILVNRFSASASEVLSACLQDNQRAVVVGERTWGKGSVQNVIRMESGESALKLTTASYHRPSGVNIHRFPDSKKEDEWGVKPSEGFEVSLTPEQWEQWIGDREQTDVLRSDASTTPERTFKDPQLAKALDYVNEKLGTNSPAASTPVSDETSPKS